MLGRIIKSLGSEKFALFLPSCENSKIVREDSEILAHSQLGYSVVYKRLREFGDSVFLKLHYNKTAAHMKNSPCDASDRMVATIMIYHTCN